MPIHIKNKKVDGLLNQLVQLTGESKTEALIHSLEERYQKLEARRKAKIYKKLKKIIHEVSKLPDKDMRTPDEIIGYNEFGMFD